MSKRGNGEGSVSQRADGRWSYRWTEPDTGRRRSGYAKTQREAVRALREALNRVEDGQPAIESSATFKTTAETWHKTVMIRRGVTLRTLQTYSPALRLHAYPVIGAVRMKDLRAAHIVAVMQKMEEAGLSASYMNIVHKAVSSVCNMAVEDGLIRSNPARVIHPARPGRTTKVVPTRAQVLALLDAATDPRLHVLLVVLSHTGLRINEALSLRWADWDGAETLRVMFAKGDKARAVPVTPALAAELKAWRKVQLAERLAADWWHEDADLIIATNLGTQWDASNARRELRRLTNGPSGICPGLTPHSLRHAAATFLLEEGIPMRVVSELLGHSSTRVTAEIYSHVTARLVADAATAMGRALTPTDTNADTNARDDGRQSAV